MNGLVGLVLAMALSAASFSKQESRVIKWASAEQREAFNYGPYPICLSGGWGSGKTYGCCLKALALSTEYPKNRGVIARHVGRDLRDTTMATFYKVCPPHLYDARQGGRRNDQNGYLKLADSQSEILFVHLDDPDAAGFIRGLEANWFLIDQAEENPDHMEELFDMLCGRLGRWDMAEVPQRLIDRAVQQHGAWPYLHPETKKPVPPAYAMLCCNPDVETHWIYRRFHPDSPEHHERYAQRGYKMFHMPTEGSIFAQGTQNLENLLQMDEAFVRRNVKGLWGQPEGAIHVVPSSSVLEGTPDLEEWLIRTCTLFRGFDYGDSAPTCCVWAAVDRNGNVFLYREYYVPNAIISAHRANIAALSGKEHYELDLADPSIFYQMPMKQGGRWSVADEYGDVVSQPRQTAIFWTPADNNELGTRNRINEYLRVDPERIHPITKQPGSARLFFVTRNDGYPNGILYTLQQTRAQRRVKIGTNLGKPEFSDERDPNIPDHAYDAGVRYIIASRPPIPRDEVIRMHGTFLGARRLAKQYRQQGTVR